MAERRVWAQRLRGGAIASQPSTQAVPETLREAVAASEREVISRALRNEDRRMDDVVAALGIEWGTLNEKIVRLGLNRKALLSD